MGHEGPTAHRIGVQLGRVAQHHEIPRHAHGDDEGVAAGVLVSCCEGADLDEVVGEDAVFAPGSAPWMAVSSVRFQP